MKLLTLARDLQRRKARERQRLFVVEGIRAVEELLRSSLDIRGALIAAPLDSDPRAGTLRTALAHRAVEVITVSEPDFSSAAQTDTPQGVLAIARIPERSMDSLEFPTRARFLALDAVQDPGNAGTLVRTAAALGAAATLLLPGTVDVWNAKVVRSAMGTLFHHPVVDCTWDALDEFRRTQRCELWGADASGTSIDGGRVPDRVVLLVGNEGHGLSDAARGRLDRSVAIAIAPDVESLNVAVAAGILLHQLRS